LGTHKETETCLYKAERVRKDHPRIAFRGCLDELYAQTVCCQLVLHRDGYDALAQQLSRLLPVIRSLLSSEYSGDPFSLSAFDALDWEDLHEASHCPKAYYGIDHPIVQAKMGESVAALNLLRTKIRGCERMAVSTFDDKREDIVHALNRMSSAVYAFMCSICATMGECSCR